METWISSFEAYFQEYGYAAVFFFLLLENAGLPLPGETALLYASFLASRDGRLRLYAVIAVAIVAAAIGDNIGYWLGRKGGRTITRILRLTEKRLHYFKRFFARYGGWTVFFARFVAGLRIITGPAAGLTGMEWRRFVLCNVAGAVVWVTCIACVGFYFGQNWNVLVSWVKRFNIVAIVIVLSLVVVYVVHTKRRGDTESLP